MTAHDGYDLTVILDCGDTMRLSSIPGWRDPERGDYYACSSHSPVYGYDPQTGEPLHERDRQVIEVRRELRAVSTP
jgi:hypothetical protein